MFKDPMLFGCLEKTSSERWLFHENPKWGFAGRSPIYLKGVIPGIESWYNNIAYTVPQLYVFSSSDEIYNVGPPNVMFCWFRFIPMSFLDFLGSINIHKPNRKIGDFRRPRPKTMVGFGATPRCAAASWPWDPAREPHVDIRPQRWDSHGFTMGKAIKPTWGHSPVLRKCTLVCGIDIAKNVRVIRGSSLLNSGW